MTLTMFKELGKLSEMAAQQQLFFGAKGVYLLLIHPGAIQSLSLTPKEKYQIKYRGARIAKRRTLMGKLINMLRAKCNLPPIFVSSTPILYTASLGMFGNVKIVDTGDSDEQLP